MPHLNPHDVMTMFLALIDFDSRDGKPARLIILILTGDNQSQRDLLGDASELFSPREAVDRALNASSFVELVAALNAPVR